MPLEIVYSDPRAVGYHPVLYMAKLAAQLFDANLTIVERRPLSAFKKLTGLIPRSRNGNACLLISPSPDRLLSISYLEGWRRRYGRLVAWVFDSFWTDYIPRFASLANHFDQIFITEQEDLAAWQRKVRAPVRWLPWGSDALNLGSASPERPIDLLRVGRQPGPWNDDAANAGDCDQRGLRFRGRVPSRDDAAENERMLMEAYGQAKFSLSFSNAVNPAANTHPKREYITARWTDALASGATVAGVPPKGETVNALLWDEALLNLGTVDRAAGADLIAEAARAWTPRRAQLNHRRALERLDWRWRFKELKESLGVSAPRLDAELGRLKERIASSAGA